MSGILCRDIFTVKTPSASWLSWVGSGVNLRPRVACPATRRSCLGAAIGPAQPWWIVGVWGGDVKSGGTPRGSVGAYKRVSVGGHGVAAGDGLLNASTLLRFHASTFSPSFGSISVAVLYSLRDKGLGGWEKRRIVGFPVDVEGWLLYHGVRVG